MKIKNHRKIEYWFYPPKNSSLEKHCYVFKYKKDLINFLEYNFYQAINGEVIVHVSDFSGFYTLREYFVWLKRKTDGKRKHVNIQLKQELFRGRKFVCKSKKIEKTDKKWFAFSDKIISLMCKNANNWTPNSAKNLIELFKKRGWKDFIPDKDDQDYINYYLEKGIDFFHWSDRCNSLRSKVIYEYFKKEKLINEL
jgi:hypothetical protein